MILIWALPIVFCTSRATSKKSRGSYISWWYNKSRQKVFIVNQSETAVHRGWAEPESKLFARIEILVFVWRLPQIQAFWLQLSGRKEEKYIRPIYLFRNFNVKVKLCSSGFLPNSCIWNAGIFGGLRTNTRILILAESLDSGSAQPLAVPVCRLLGSKI